MSDQPELFKTRFWDDHDLLRDECIIPGGLPAKALLWLLLSRTGQNRTTWDADVEELARTLQISVSTVRRKIGELKAASLLEAIPLVGRRGRYRFRVIRSNLPDFRCHGDNGRAHSESGHSHHDNDHCHSENDTTYPQQKEQQDPQQTPQAAGSAAGEEDSAEVEQVVTAWNALGTPFPRCEQLTGKRRKALRSRLRDEAWRRKWREALARLPTLPFLCGSGDRGWVATFDFFLRPDSVTKILEGQYQDLKNHGPNSDRRSSAHVFDPGAGAQRLSPADF